ncbi:MAG: GHKL domain-containing protein [Lentimicrobium sp.]|nr:GHKL domain-containing protein [Lentimicrobium sp.]
MSLFEKNRLLIFFLASLFFAGMVYLTIHISKVDNSPEKVIHRLERILNSRYENLKKYAGKIENPEMLRKMENMAGSDIDLPKGFELVIYKNEQPVFWTDNSYFETDYAQKRNSERIHYNPNGIYQYFETESSGYIIVLSDLIKHKYPYQNNYLSASFPASYRIPASWIIGPEPADHEVKSNDGKVLFYLKNTTEQYISGPGQFFIWTGGLLFLLFSILLLYNLYKLIPWFSKKKWFFTLFIADVLILRFILQYFRIPSRFYLSGLFDPASYASSALFPNLGDTLISLYVILIVGILFYDYLLNYTRSANEKPTQKSYAFLFRIAFTSLLYSLCIYIIDSLFINSTFELDFSQILNFSVLSYFVFIAIAMALFVFFLFSYPLIRIDLKEKSLAFYLSTIIVFYFFAFFIFKISGLYAPHPAYLIFLILYVALIFFYFHKKKRTSIVSFALVLTVILTGSSGYSHYKNLEIKERNERKLLALRISTDRDNIAEYLFSELEQALKNDIDLKIMVSAASVNFSLEQEIKSYIRAKYFKGYWNRYMAQITLCFPDKTLRIKPTDYLIGCDAYFDDIIASYSSPTLSPNLFYISESYDVSSYIARLPVVEYERDIMASIVIEFYKKYVPKGLGYPELLLDNSVTSYADISAYSYAIFAGNELVKNAGEYNYSEYEASSVGDRIEGYFYDHHGFNHYVYNIENGRTIIISKKKNKIIDKLTPLTYQLTFHLLLVLIFISIHRLLSPHRKKTPSLKIRLQLMMVALILFASALIGWVTLNNIIDQNNIKNQDILSEKAHSVLIELEHKLASADILDESERDYLQELLTKFSLIFFSDINLYNPSGTLMASSRKEIFAEGLKSVKMQRDAYIELAINKKTLFLHEEKIGSYPYLSAYIPFRDNQNKTTAFINLPYFARQQEIQQEISTFLVTIINIYVILTALAILISLFVANYLTWPLQLIRDRFSKLNLNTGIDKIEYKRDDELGDLINEYNLMVEKLAESAAQLARSERESAWREMARQVAHEIKNPLTPMKLSIQHLQKAWNDHTPDWQAKLDKTTKTLIQQIDSLSAIASAFSDFAKLPIAKNSKIELSSILYSNISLFSNYPNINVAVRLPENPCYVFADEKQLSRVFINLITNSIQAMPSGFKGQITISVTSQNLKHRIIIQDNGVGMNEEQQKKVFSPNFTTKSSGMGLGLAMAKNIIESVGGTIEFTSTVGKGATFEIEIPEYQEE